MQQEKPPAWWGYTVVVAVTASPSSLFGLAGTALLGAVLPFHPIDLIYNYGIRFLLRKRPLPPNGAPRAQRPGDRPAVSFTRDARQA